ncbi:MAG: succinate dehydrogenase cytochrome b subunit [Luteibaculaceae bacterium]
MSATNTALLSSSIAKKYWMAITGLFLCLFLVGHLLGNLQLFMAGEAGQLQFNAYAKFMTTNPVVRILSIVTFASILFHIIDAILLTSKNNAARPVKYAFEKPSANSNWKARNMGILGSIITIFIAVHLSNFWYKMKFGSIPYDSAGNLDLHTVVVEFFKDPSYGVFFVAFYVVCMLFMGLHLMHGFQSAFLTLGINHRKYTPIIEKVGIAFSVIVPLAFAIIPIYIYLT